MNFKVSWKSNIAFCCTFLFFLPLFGQPLWLTDPSDLVLICEEGTDHSPDINLWLQNYGGGVFSDGCGNPMATNDFTGLTPDCGGADSVLVTFTVTDMCNESASRTAYIAIIDTLPPTFSAIPQDITLACSQNPDTPPVITADDLCDPDATVIFASINEQTNDGSCTDFSYDLRRFWIASDACGNTDTIEQVITIQDLIAPTFTRPVDITITCSDDQTPANTGNPFNINDNCDPNPTATFVDFITLEGCPNNFTISRFWSVTDACGNSGAQEEQTIIVRDFSDPQFTQPAVDEDFDCTNRDEAEAAFQAWVANYGGAIASDNCTPDDQLQWFAAVPGSYDLNNFNTWPGTHPGTLVDGSCINDPILRTETVDFVVYDLCNRASISRATFRVVDFSAPVFEFCPTDILLDADANNCQAAVHLPLPIISEACDNNSSTFNANTSSGISSDSPGDENVIVNSVTLTIEGIPTPPALANDDVQIQIDLINIDGEAATEFFNIYLEDGTLIGPTNPTVAQCGTSNTSFSVNADDFKLLALDGKITIELIPNIPDNNPGSFGINDICPGGSTANMSISFDYNFPQNLKIQYSVNGADAQDFDLANTPNLILDQGTHSIIYTAEDCAGNSSQCNFLITVEDNLAPTISCPNNILGSLSSTDDCSQGIEIALPYPELISDDCSFDQFNQTQPQGSDQLLTFAYDPNYLEYMAESKVMTFTNVSANAVGPTVRFLLELEGDIEDPDEYFLIYDENGNILAATRVGLPYVTYTPGDCNGNLPKVIADINVPVATYYQWASDGVITIEARPNTNFVLPPPGSNSDGINPSCVIFPNGTPDGQNDGQSKMSIRLETQTTNLNYQITGATSFGPAPVPSPSGFGTHFFNLGQSTVTYTAMDNEGNEGSCSFQVEIIDEIAPTVICNATTIFINPSGTVTYTLTPDEIDAGSTDNCSIAERTVSPNTFDCQQIGTTVEVTLTVIDGSGNVDSCTALVAIEGETPKPTFSVSLCGNDSLLLFANPPMGQGAILYTYTWQGPNGFTSNEENPVILNATDNDAGSYSVTIEGVTNCSASGAVEVTLNPDIAKPIISQPAITCEGDDLSLFVNIADGDLYTWTAPNFSTIETPVPILILSNVDASIIGNWTVSVNRNGCDSPDATPVFVDVESSPNVMAANDGPVCEDSMVQLSATEISGVSYSWSGPNNFSAVIQNPTAAAVPGLYTVTATTLNGCTATATTQVFTLQKPNINTITIDGANCLTGNSDIQLIPAITGGTGNYTYDWTGPNNYTSIAPIAIIPNASSQDNGAYQLIVTDANNCASVPFEVVLTQNDTPPTPTITGEESICAGSDITILSNPYSGNEVLYHWFTNNDEIISTIPSLQLDNLDQNTLVQLYVEVDGCSSTFSNILNIAVQPQPDQPATTGTSMVCSGGTISLETDLINDATYFWAGPGGFNSSVHNPSIANATTNNAGDYQVQITINGCSSIFSELFNVAVSSEPQTPIIGPAEGVCLDDDNAAITLSITAGSAVAGATYTWYEAGSNNIVSSASTSLNAMISDLSGYSQGQAEFYVIADVQGCSSLSSIPVSVDLFSIPNESSFAGDDFLLCDAETLILEASAPGEGTGVWTQVSGPGNPLIANANDPNTVLSDLVANQTYVFAWTLSNGACQNYDADEVAITFEPIPQANTDFIEVPFAGATEFNVKENDQIDIEFFIEVVSSPSFGTLAEMGEGIYQFQANDNYAGADEFMYKVCNQNCPSSCTEATVNLAIGSNAPCDIPSIFTPNNDGINDSFIIPCLALDDFPNNQMIIFNQWGDEVFQASPYRNDWMGTFSGEVLPVGTYYYVLDLGNSQTPASGFIIIEY